MFDSAKPTLNVLHVASGDLWGGAEAQINALAGELHKRPDVQVAVVLMNSETQLQARLTARGVCTVALNEARSSSARLAGELFKLLRTHRPHLVHTHRFKENVLAGTLAGMLGIPSIRTVHGAPEPILRSGGIRRRLINAVDCWAARRVQYCAVAVSQELAGQLQTLLPGAQIALIRNGIDVQEVRTRAARTDVPPPPKLGRWRIGLVGRLVSIKRADLFLRVGQHLQQLGLGKVELCIVGEGPQRHELERLSEELGLSGVVNFCGFVPNPAPLLSTFDALLMTSDHEGLPVVALEALALGVPVIARAVGGLPEVLGASDKAVLVDSADPREIAQRTAQWLVQHGDLAADRQSSSVLPPHFEIGNVAAQYTALYRRAISGTRTSGNTAA